MAYANTAVLGYGATGAGKSLLGSTWQAAKHAALAPYYMLKMTDSDNRLVRHAVDDIISRGAISNGDLAGLVDSYCGRSYKLRRGLKNSLVEAGVVGSVDDIGYADEKKILGITFYNYDSDRGVLGNAMRQFTDKRALPRDVFTSSMMYATTAAAGGLAGLLNFTAYKTGVSAGFSALGSGLKKSKKLSRSELGRIVQEESEQIGASFAFGTDLGLAKVAQAGLKHLGKRGKVKAASAEKAGIALDHYITARLLTSAYGTGWGQFTAEAEASSAEGAHKVTMPIKMPDSGLAKGEVSAPYDPVGKHDPFEAPSHEVLCRTAISQGLMPDACKQETVADSSPANALKVANQQNSDADNKTELQNRADLPAKTPLFQPKENGTWTGIKPCVGCEGSHELESLLSQYKPDYARHSLVMDSENGLVFSRIGENVLKHDIGGRELYVKMGLDLNNDGKISGKDGEVFWHKITEAEKESGKIAFTAEMLKSFDFSSARWYFGYGAGTEQAAVPANFTYLASVSNDQHCAEQTFLGRLQPVAEPKEQMVAPKEPAAPVAEQRVEPLAPVVPIAPAQHSFGDAFKDVYVNVLGQGTWKASEYPSEIDGRTGLVSDLLLSDLDPLRLKYHNSVDNMEKPWLSEAKYSFLVPESMAVFERITNTTARNEAATTIFDFAADSRDVMQLKHPDVLTDLLAGKQVDMRDAYYSGFENWLGRGIDREPWAPEPWAHLFAEFTLGDAKGWLRDYELRNFYRPLDMTTVESFEKFWRDFTHFPGGRLVLLADDSDHDGRLDLDEILAIVKTPAELNDTKVNEPVRGPWKTYPSGYGFRIGDPVPGQFGPGDAPGAAEPSAPSGPTGPTGGGSQTGGDGVGAR